MTDTPDLSLAAHDLNFHLHGTELAAALARADAAEALTTEVTRLLAAEVIRLRQENERLRQRVTILWEENNAARAALEEDHDV